MGIGSTYGIVVLIGCLMCVTNIVHPLTRQYQLAPQTQLVQRCHPLTFVLLGVHILYFAAHLYVFVQRIFSFHNSYACVYQIAVTFYHLLVVVLIHQHSCNIPLLVELLVELQVYIGIIWILAHAKPAIACSADMRSIQLEHGAVLTTHLCSSLPSITNLALEGPLASGLVCAIWIQGCQHIGVLIGKRSHMVDRSCHIVQSTIRTEGHILRTLRLGNNSQSLLRITQRHQQRLTWIIAVFIEHTRIVGFVCIFYHGVPTIHLQLCTYATCTYPFWQIVIIVVLTFWLNNGVKDDRVLFLVLAHIATANRQVSTCFLQLWNPLVQT